MRAAQDSIAAVASAPGRSATGLIRLSGPATAAALEDALGQPAHDAGAWSGRFALANGVSVAVRVVVFTKPRSYTGEDAAEIYAPGNPFLLERMLHQLCASKGVRLAQPGEFTQRAFLNGRLRVEQAEGVAAMIAAAGDDELLAARELLSGRAGSAQRALAERCAQLLALVEAGVDFTDQEDVRPISPAQLGDGLASLACALERAGGEDALAAGREARAVRVVIAGAPNAGKSTLFNALLGRTRALVSAEAGATRDAIEEPLDLSGVSPWAPEVSLVDLAGLDAAFASRSSADAAAQARARETVAEADVIVHCDPSGRFEPLPSGAAVTLRVRTKADLEQFTPFFGGMGVSPVPSVQSRVRRPRRQGAGELAVCALDGWRIAALKRAIGDAASSVGRTSALARVAPRHAQALSRALAAVRETRATSSASQAASLANEELIAHWLRDALDALGEISGKALPDDVLGRIFATFCVGK